MSKAPATPAPTGLTPFSELGFWATYVAGWLAYSGLFISVGMLLQEFGIRSALAAAGMNVLPPALVGVPVALRRRDLLRPEWGLGRTVVVQAGVGIVYAVTIATVVTGLGAVFGFEEPGMAEAGAAAAILYRSVASGFLYVILAGFLMWAESLRRVQESHTLIAREAVLRAQAEAKALRAQFNPHFVFNTLHSLMLLVRADPTAAEQAIEDVATLIRYASILQRKEVDTVPLTKELAVAKRYVALEALRLEDRLEVTWSVDPGTEELSAPAFSLQTLMENAIKHGVEPVPAGGRVDVRVSATDEVLTFSVSDNGAGAEADDVLQEGHGLHLLQRRLNALYGDAASLEWATRPGEGFKVTVHVPVAAPGTVEELAFIQSNGGGSP